MNQKLLPLVIAGVGFCATTQAADVDVKIYGKANISYNMNDFETNNAGTVGTDQDNWTLNSNASRLGFKGSLPVSNDLKAIFKMEYEVSIDGDNADTFGQRNIYAGLEGDWGSVIAGKIDTPVKISQGKIDRFNDLDHGDIKHMMVGENRVGNIVMYRSKKFGDVSVLAAIMPGEDDGSAADEDNGFADHFSVAVMYEANGLYLSAGIDDNVKNTDILRLVGEYSFSSFKIGALFQTADQNKDGTNIGSIKAPLSSTGLDSYKEQDAYLVSGQWTSSKNIVLKAQYVHSASTPSATATMDDTDATQLILGADYKLNKKTKLYTYYSQTEAEADTSVINGDIADTTFGVGFELKF